MSTPEIWGQLELLDFSFLNRTHHPGDFFVPKPRKPPITIAIQDPNPDDIASAIVSSSVVDEDAINYMIYTQLQQMKATLAENWESFGVEIGKKGDIITPLSLLEVNISSGDPKPKANLPMKTHSCTAKQAMYYIFAPITLVDITYEGQMKALAAKMAAAVPYGQKLTSVSHLGVAEFYRKLCFNRTYRTMAAALDMFLERFPDHAECKMRVGTECTRFKHCTANLLIPHFGTLMGISDTSQLLKWILDAGAANNAKKLMDPRNALDDPYSYAPYFYYMGLGEKSVAAVKHNLDLQVFVHTVGAILGNERSKKAKMLRDCTVMTMRTAFLVGAIRSVHGQLDAMKNSVDESPKTEIDDEIKKAGKCPSSMDATSWIKYLKGTPGLSIAYMKKGARMALGLTNLRPGTIGEACVKEAERIRDGQSVLLSAF